METLYVELNSLTASKYSNFQDLMNSEELSHGGTTYSKCFKVVET